MAKVNINSAIRAHPATTGPAVTSIIGLRIRNAIIEALYQSGASPKKLSLKAWGSEVVILFPLFKVSAKWWIKYANSYIC